MGKTKKKNDMENGIFYSKLVFEKVGFVSLL